VIWQDFVHCFGYPAPGSAVDLQALGLEQNQTLRSFAAEVGLGTFADGLISIGSLRELGAQLCGWASWVPADSRLFGSTALGLLFLVSGDDDVWVIDAQEGIVVESDLSVAELLHQVTSGELLRGSLRASLFQAWNDRSGALPPESVLCPTPALPLGGTWSADTLARVSLPVYLAFTSSLFRPDGDTPVELRRR